MKCGRRARESRASMARQDGFLILPGNDTGGQDPGAHEAVEL